MLSLPWNSRPHSHTLFSLSLSHTYEKLPLLGCNPSSGSFLNNTSTAFPSRFWIQHRWLPRRRALCILGFCDVLRLHRYHHLLSPRVEKSFDVHRRSYLFIPQTFFPPASFGGGKKALNLEHDKPLPPPKNLSPFSLKM